MLTYFLLFTIVGAVIGFVLSPKAAAICYVLIALVWSAIYGPTWALISFAEMGTGFFVVTILNGKKL